MASFSRLTALNRILEIGMIPLFYHHDPEVGKKIIDACSRGGAKVVEFTNRGDGAPLVFIELAAHVARNDPNVILGAGSIVDAPTAALYIAHGANFIVGPNLNPEVARLCNRRKVAYIPGCASATEIAQAEELGVEIVKIFPSAAVGGPSFIKELLGPCPWTRIMPTGKVDAREDSINAWFGAGAACLGMGSDLIDKQAVATGQYDSISVRIAQTLEWIQKARAQSSAKLRGQVWKS